MKKIIGVLMVLLSLNSVAQEKQGEIHSVSTDEFQQYIEKYGTDLLIDVRTPQEYNAGHIPGAHLVNLYAPDFKTRILEIVKDKDKPVLIYCRSGHRSMIAAKYLAGHGYTVINLRHGIIDWNANRKPIGK